MNHVTMLFFDYIFFCTKARQQRSKMAENALSERLISKFGHVPRPHYMGGGFGVTSLAYPTL